MQPASDRSELGHNVRRYGPLVVIVVLLLAVGAVAILGGDESGNDDATTETTGDRGRVAVGAPARVGRMPITHAEADDANAVDDYTWPASCDTETGYTRLPSVFGTPCVPEFAGDNGGTTASGVTADKITIVRYVADQSSDLSALLGAMGANDTPAQRSQTFRDYIEIFGSVSELYGREIEVIDYQGTGASDDVVAAKADATQIIAEHAPFAVIQSPGLDRGTFAGELAAHKILCIDCGGGVPDAVVQENAGYIWGGLPSTDQLLANLDVWVNGAAAGSDDAGQTPAPNAPQANAVFAGDESYHDRPRKVGVVHFEQDPPIFVEDDDDPAEELGYLREPYLLDFATLPTKATEIMAKFKQQGITTVVFLGDPIMPISLTEAATEQEYFPEWIFTGTALTDTNVMGRQFDPVQMAHAFGISQLPVPVNQDLQESIRIHRWWKGDDTAIPPAAAQYNLIAPVARFLVNGIHMAGPDLSRTTFEQGMFRIPPAGGTATAPQVSYGNWGFFPEPDYWGIDDSTEVWWDGEYEAEDERGVVGKGVWRRSGNGERFTTRDVTTPRPFEEQDSVTVLETLPADAVPPSYPPPPGSPAAGG